ERGTPLLAKPPLNPLQERLWHTLEGWDGVYLSTSRGPIAFEALGYQIARIMFLQRYNGDEELSTIAATGDAWKSAVHAHLNKLDDGALEPLLREALEEAEEDFETFETWGQKHTIHVQHILGNVPWLGKRFRLDTFGADGSSDTLFKRASSPGPGEQTVRYGANARHISDLTDLDANWFVLFGGNDGWVISPQTADQVQLWKRGEYMQLPMRLETVRTMFTHVNTISPSTDTPTPTRPTASRSAATE
ncbi:MAG: penicillin acylase family protein, partial [Myxococcota bacterium]